jgi:hypothetical protein
MAALMIWLVTVGVGLGLLVVTAALHKLALNAFICALISINFCIMVLREHEQRITSRGQLLQLMATNARYQGCNWLWMSLAILAMRLPGLAFNGATNYALGGLAASTLCLCAASLIRGALVKHPERIENLLRITGFLALSQLVGAAVIIVGLIGHSMEAGARVDWPSLNVIAFSTVALAVISARALLSLLMGAPASATAATGAPVVPMAPWHPPRGMVRATAGR